MGLFEILIIGAAGFFLFWLWRGGGQARSTTATPTDFVQHARQPRPLGCFGMLGMFFMAGLLLFLAVRTNHLFLSAAFVAVGLVLIACIGRWGRVGGMVAMLVIAVTGASFAALLAMIVVRTGSNPHTARFADEWLDGPAAQLSPFHWNKVREIQAKQEQHRARMRNEVRQWQQAVRGRGPVGMRPPTMPIFDHRDPTIGGASLELHLRAGALGPLAATPDDLAATLLTLLATVQAASEDPAGAKLASLYDLPVTQAKGGTLPLSKVSHIRKRTLSGAPQQITRVLVAPHNDRRPERELLEQVASALQGTAQQRVAEGKPAGFYVRWRKAALQIDIEPPMPAGMIPIDAPLAAATATPTAIPAATPAPATIETDKPAPSTATRAETPTNPAIAALPPRKTPDQGSWVDTVVAYQLLLWTLPESLGGLAEYRSTPATSVAVASATAPVTVEPRIEVAVAASTPEAPTPDAPSSVAPSSVAPPATPAIPAAPSPVSAPSVASPPAVPVPVASAPPAPATVVPPQPAIAPAAPAVPLSTPIESHSSPRPAIAGDPPAWLNDKREFLDSDGNFWMRRSTGRLYDTPEESQEAVGELAVEMTDEYVRRLLGADAAGATGSAPKVTHSMPIVTILNNFVEQQYDELGPSPGLPDEMAWETHVLMKFDRDDRALVERTWRNQLAQHNLRYTGAAAGLVLALLGTLFGYLKIDTATRGFYSGRLKLAAGAIVAAITTLGILLVAGTLPL